MRERDGERLKGTRYIRDILQQGNESLIFIDYISNGNKPLHVVGSQLRLASGYWNDWSSMAAIQRIVQTGRPKSLSTKGQLSRNNQTEFSPCSFSLMPAKHQKGLVWNWEEGNGSWLSNVLIIDVSESRLSILPNEGFPRDPSTGQPLMLASIALKKSGLSMIGESLYWSTYLTFETKGAKK